MAQWLYHAYDLASGAALGTVPMERWTHDEWLTGDVAWDATMQPGETSDLTRSYVEAVNAGRTVIYAERVDDFGASRLECTAYLPPGGDRRPDLSGTGLLGYLNGRPFEASQSWGSDDQFIIVRDLIQATPGALIDTSQLGLSGIPRAQTWNNWEAKPVGEAITDLSNRINGFDFFITAELNGLGDPVRRIRAWYPRRGSGVAPIGGLSFEYGRNMLTMPVPEGNPDFASRVVALGVEIDADAGTRYVSVATDAALFATVPIVAVLDRSDITTQAGLDQAAAGELARRSSFEDAEISFRVDPLDTAFPWGSWQLGDDCWMQMDAGQSVWWPDGLAEVRRVIGHRWEVTGDGEALTVTTGRQWGT